MAFKFKQFNEIKNNFFMKLYFFFHKAPLYIAVEKAKIEIIKLLLSCNKLDINLLNIFKNKNFYVIQNN